MTINGIKTDAKEFAYDGCHKIYLIENDNDKKECLETSYEILPISKLKQTYKNSCSLKFINNWSLTTSFVSQFENAKIIN